MLGSRSVELRRDREQRYRVDRDQAHEVLLAAAAHLPRERPGAVAYYRTLYLDSADRRYLAPGVETRLRLRQYATARDLEAPPRIGSDVYLELKQSVGDARSKQRLALHAMTAQRLLDGDRDAVDPAALAGAPELAAALGDVSTGLVRPVLLTWYRRLCLADDAVRVTFDEAIAYCAPERVRPNGALAEPGRILANAPHGALEVKLRGAAPAWLDCALAGLEPGRASSKYRDATRALARRQPLGAATLQLPALVA